LPPLGQRRCWLHGGALEQFRAAGLVASSAADFCAPLSDDWLQSLQVTTADLARMQVTTADLARLAYDPAPGVASAAAGLAGSPPVRPWPMSPSPKQRTSGQLSRRVLAARRQRRRRELVKAGLSRYVIAADDHRLVGYLIATDRISEDAARSHCAIESALRQLVDDVVERFGG
jgi:hypothetical protein